jgi:prevent-host-death family protein
MGALRAVRHFPVVHVGVCRIGLRNIYIRSMTEVASRELRNDTAGLIKRAAAGEDIVITVHGKPAARLTSLTGRRSGFRVRN